MKAKASKLDGYSARLQEWFLSGKTLKEAQEQLALDGCSVSLGRLSEWWQSRQASMQEEALLRQIASGANQCREVESAFGKNPAPGLETIMALQRVLIMKLSTQANADPTLIELVARFTKPVLEFARLQQASAQIKLDERRVTLLEEAAERARKTEEVLDSNVSAEDQAKRIREIFKK